MKKIIIAVLLFALLFSFCACKAEEEPLKIITITDTHFTGKEYYSYEGTFLSANAIVIILSFQIIVNTFL